MSTILEGKTHRDLPPAQQRPGRNNRPEQRAALPGLDTGRPATPAPSGPPSRQGSSDHQGVRPEWRNVVLSADGRAWDANTGEAVEAERPSGAPMRAVQPAPSYTRQAGLDGATVPPPQAISAAIDKAAEGEWWRLVSWQADWQCYLVPSRTEPGHSYRVGRRTGAKRDDPWWWRYVCDCKAHTSGRYLACWHKAACELALTRVYRVKGGGPAPTV